MAHLGGQEHQDGLEQHRARPLPDAPRTAGRKARPDVLRQARMVELRAQTDELVLAQAHWALVRQASLRPPQRGLEPAPSVRRALLLELQPQALLEPLASRSAQVQSVLWQRAQRWLAAERQVRPQASSARPSPRHPLRPSPPWPWLRQPLQLRLVPGDSCGPFRRHPRGWSSSASFFPLRRTRAKGQ
jgi:hypothetical protein